MGLMIVGIGFVAVLTGAIAQRFLSDEAERIAEEAADLETAELDVVAELREVMTRIEGIERSLSARAGS
jgi:hypothetical protein